MKILSKFKTIFGNFLIILLTLFILYCVTFIYFNFIGEGEEYNARREAKIRSAEKLRAKIIRAKQMGQGVSPIHSAVVDREDAKTKLARSTRKSMHPTSYKEEEYIIDKVHALIIVDRNGKHLETIRFKESDYQNALENVTLVDPFN